MTPARALCILASTILVSNTTVAALHAWHTHSPTTTALAALGGVACLGALLAWLHATLLGHARLRMRADPALATHHAGWARALSAALHAQGVLPNDGAAYYDLRSGTLHHPHWRRPYRFPLSAFVRHAQERVAHQAFASHWKRRAFLDTPTDTLPLPAVSAHDTLAARRLLGTFPHMPPPPKPLPLTPGRGGLITY